MNKIILKGQIKNIEYSHTIKDIDYDKANIIVARPNGKEDLINLKFKRFSNKYKDGDQVSLIGNIRSFSQKLPDRNKVEIYVFTYFDDLDENEEVSANNIVEIDGRICKKNGLRKTIKGKDVLDFTIANNVVTYDQSLNCYIPCVAWGQQAKDLDKLPIGSKIMILGQLQSREYRKKLSEDEEDYEIKVAHEVYIDSYEVVNASGDKTENSSEE